MFRSGFCRRSGWCGEGMRSRNLALLVLGVVVSGASAAAIVALDEAGILSLTPSVEKAGGRTPSTMTAPFSSPAPIPKAVDRFAYVPPDAVAFLAPRLAYSAPLDHEPADADELPSADDLPLSDTPETEITGSWAVEVEPEVSEPQSAGLPPQTGPWQTTKPRLPPRSYALAKRLAQISPGANARLASKFEAAGASWQPSDLALVAIKDEKYLELFARPEGGQWKFIHRYPVLAASGRAGPKLRQGDRQVPEGVYSISYLNPNSRYHVSLRVNYPNAFDRRMAAADGRSNLGGDIMIHGKAVSVGCLAVGDEAAEELFALAANVGLPNIKLIIAPTDFRRRSLPTVDTEQPSWLPGLYTEVAAAMSEFKSPPPPVSLLSFFGN